MLPPVRIELSLWLTWDSKSKILLYLRFQAQHSPFWANWAFACRTETLGYLYSRALLILIKSFKVQKSSGA